MSTDFQRTTLHYIPEDRTLQNHRYENLKSYGTEFIDHQSDYTSLNIFGYIF
jgi:hypothetical protein